LLLLKSESVLEVGPSRETMHSAAQDNGC